MLFYLLGGAKATMYPIDTQGIKNEIISSCIVAQKSNMKIVFLLDNRLQLFEDYSLYYSILAIEEMKKEKK